ncbi:hypothetical protein EAI_10421 [Harpegnathos saltator]|uniref:Uncharacterized protein n=1 Tax=Harpegnathos saltator TaxID=610380 RepID=E2BXJ1_HARSA|nr:hypothetical protein EAI_10421 [Harpegnathos saltator]
MPRNSATAGKEKPPKTGSVQPTSGAKARIELIDLFGDDLSDIDHEANKPKTAPVTSQPNAATASKAPVNPATQRRPTCPRPPSTTQKPTITAIQILQPGVRPPTSNRRSAPRHADGTTNQPTITTGRSTDQAPKVEACYGGMAIQPSPTPPTSPRTVQEAQRRPPTRTDPTTAAFRSTCTPPSLVALAPGLTVIVP